MSREEAVLDSNEPPLFKYEDNDFIRQSFNVLNDFKDSETFCDARIKVRGKVIAAHRIVLAASNVYFRSLFTTDSESEVTLIDDLDLLSVESLLNYAYSSDLVVADQDSVSATGGVVSALISIMSQEGKFMDCQSGHSFKYKNPILFKEMFAMFREFKNSNTFCDVHIKVSEKVIHGHKVILAAGSLYFRTMFTVGLAESKQSEITMNGLDFQAIDSLVDYTYTGELLLTMESAPNLLYAASMLQFDRIRDACVSYLSDHLSVDNCSGMSSLAKLLDCQELSEAADAYFLHNFLEVVEQGELEHLSVEIMERLISSSELNVQNEEQVLEAVIGWIKFDIDARKCHLSRLLKLVRLQLLRFSYFLDNVCNERLILDDSDALSFVHTVKYDYFHLGVFPNEASLTCARRNCSQVMICMNVSCSSNTFFYDNELNKFVTLDVGLGYTPGMAVCEIYDKLYKVGGHTEEETLRSGTVWGFKDNSCKEIAEMKIPRTGLGLGSIKGVLYAFGGSNFVR